MNKFYAAFRRYQLQDTILNCKNMRNQRKQNCYNGAFHRPAELFEELWISMKEKKKSKVQIQVLPKVSPNSRSRFLTPKLSRLGEISDMKIWTDFLNLHSVMTKIGTRPTGSIGTSPEFKFGILERVTNWTFMITQTHFYWSFWTRWTTMAWMENRGWLRVTN